MLPNNFFYFNFIDDDLPPKYEDLVYQQPASTTVASGDTNNSPPRYIM